MSSSSNIKWLSKAIEQATKSANFCIAGCLPAVDPGIEIDGVGTISMPLKRGAEKRLIAACQVAPYGKGTQTLVDKRVRNTFELDPKKFGLSDAWNSAISDALRPIAEKLGLPADQLETKLYKLLVYEKGGFFLPHRDSEKHDRMVASLIVVLPNPFDGGKLVVRHGAVTQTLAFEEAAKGKFPCFAAFYTDCEHEVQRVYSGVRLCLAYNLVLKPKRGKAGSVPTAPTDPLAESIEAWVAKNPAKPLVFALNHHYTERGLSLDLLKGMDRQIASLVIAASGKTDCHVNLAQVSRHLLQSADDGSFDHGYSRYSYKPQRSEIEIGETYEDDLNGTEWTDTKGKKQPWGEISFDLSAIVSSEPIDDWKPTTEDYEGYTGNAGNTLDRWYHRSAIVIWQRDHHFEVVASSGVANSIPLFCSMTAKLAKTSEKRIEEALNDCIRFARAIIARWERHTYGRWHRDSGEHSPLDDFPEHLLKLHDRDTIAAFLRRLAEHDQSSSISSLVVAACREFGWDAFAQELKQLLIARTNKRDQEEISIRDAEWLAAFCCEKSEDPEKLALARELCVLAVGRFCEPRPSSRYSPWDHGEVSTSAKSLSLLLKALLASGLDHELAKVVQFVEESPKEFNLDDCQVPCLNSLIPWSGKQGGKVHSQLLCWLASVRQQLELATAKHPEPPSNWARPAEVACKCRQCAQLNAFLENPVDEVGLIPAREDIRRHLIDAINRHRCDVKHALERKGSPYSLKLTKTNGSFERAVKRYEANQRLLNSLPEVV